MATNLFSTRLRRVLGGACAVAVVGALVATLPASAARPTHHRRAPVYAGARYIALGDGTVFGYREPTNRPIPDYAKAKHFYGYGEIVAKDFGLSMENAACPGETSASFIAVGRPSNGCERGIRNVGAGYRKLHPLHILYVSSQLYEGIDYVRYHRKTVRLVTFMIGMEDLRLCEETTADHCAAASERDAMLRNLRKNVSNALWRLRRGAAYHGQIVVVTYYSLNYQNPTITKWTQEVNTALVRGAKSHGVRVANGFAAFKRASRQTGGNPCTAGLLTILSGGGCGTMPSAAGDALLASAVERVVRKSAQS